MRPGLRLLIVSFFLFTIASAAQSTKDAKDYSKELCVIEKSFSHIKVAEDGSSDQHQETVIRVTSQAGVQQYGLLRLPYAKATTRLEVDYVRVRKSNGEVVETSLDAVDDMPADITRQAPEYSDLREKHIAVKGLSVGDVLELSYTFHSTSLIPGEFWFVDEFEDSTIAKSMVLEIDAPADKPLKIRSETVKPLIKEQNGRTLYRWSYDVKEVKKHAADQVPDAPDLVVSTFKDWEEIGNWWSKLAAEAVEPTPEIASKARYLTAAAKNDEEKARALYTYVSSQFRYIGIGFGIGRYQPHSALDVFQNGFGDCKDKYALLAALLKAVGIPSHPALLNVTRLIDPAVPSPAQFDHVVLVAVINGKEVWLDPTQEVAPFGYLGFAERDRYSLVMRGSTANLEKTPARVAQPSTYDFNVEAELSSKGVLKGHVVSTMQGTIAMIYRAAFRTIPQTKWQELAQGISHRQGFGGQVTNVEVSGVDDPEKPLRLSYDYERNNYSEFEDHRIGPPFPATGLALREDPNDPNDPLPKVIFLGEPADMNFRASVKLPDGYLAVLPPDADVKTDFINFSNALDFKNSVLHAERHIAIEVASIPQSRRKEFLKFGRAVYDSETSMISLQGPGGSDDSTNAADSQRGAAPDSILARNTAEAAKLFEKARGELVKGQLFDAEMTLRQLLKQAPNFTSAHAMLATIYMAHNQQDKVAEEFDKEFTANPENPMPYRMYATYLTNRHEYKQARAVYARYVKNVPQDGDAWLSLAEIDSQLEDHADALVEMKKAIELNPDATRPQLNYGRLLIKSGDQEKGFATMIKAVDEDPKPDFLNTTAYEMAERAYKLDKAEAYAKEAVSAIETETSRITLLNITTFDLGRMSSLAAYWDTVGWVYYQEGKLDEAQRYLKAAWELNPDVVIGAHLGQAYEKAGKTALATETYILARSRVPVRPGLPADDSSETVKFLDRAAKKSPGYSMRSIEKIQGLRSVTLPLAPPRPETGEFYFLFGDGGKILDVKFITGDSRLNTTAAIAQIKKARFHPITLPGSPDTKIVRRGSIFCAGTNSPCNAVLFEVNQVRTTAN